METRYKIIYKKKDLKRLVKACKTTGYCSYDFETNAQPIYMEDFKPTIISISFQPGSGVSIPLQHFQAEEFCGEGYDWLSNLLYLGHQLIENPEIIKVAQNAKFDNQVWERYNIYYRGTLLDTMLAKYVLNENKPHGLKEMVRRYIPDYADYEKQNKFDKIPWDKKELQPLCKYGCTDTDMTLRLMLFLEKKLIDLGFYNTYRNLFMTASRVITSVEKEGLYVDREFNEYLLKTYRPKIDKALENILTLPRVKKFEKALIQERIDNYLATLEKEIEELDYNDPKDARKIQSRETKIEGIRLGEFKTKKELQLIEPFNLNSNPQVKALLYNHPKGFKFEVIDLTDSGEPSASEETLIKLRLTVKDPQHPKAIFLDNLLEFRGLEKMFKTYILGWNEKVQLDSRLHGKIHIHGTDSNRYSSSEPNVQQIPKTSVDPNIKKQLVAPPGMLYLACDYSQAELRMMAHLSGDETYLTAFREGVDPHLAIAINKYGADQEEIVKVYNDESHPDYKLWKNRRKQAKQIAFGLIYGIGPGLLAQKLSDPKEGLIVTKEEAKQTMDEFFEEHPKILKFKEKQEKFLKKHGYYLQLFGTKRRLPEIFNGDKEEQAYALRLGMNFPCQGAAANMTNFGAVLIYWAMRQGKLPMMRECCTVHDALYYYTLPEYINTWTISYMWEILRNPRTKEYFGFQINDVNMDMDFTIGRSMAEELPFIPGYDYKKLLLPDFSVEEYMEEHKAFKGIPIEKYPKLYAKQIKRYEKDFRNS